MHRRGFVSESTALGDIEAPIPPLPVDAPWLTALAMLEYLRRVDLPDYSAR